MSTAPRPDGWDLLLDSQTHARRGRLVQVQADSAIIQHLRHGDSNPVLVYFPRSACYKTPANRSLLCEYAVGQDVLVVLSTYGYKPVECFFSAQFVCPYTAVVYGEGVVLSAGEEEIWNAVVRSQQFGDLKIHRKCAGVRQGHLSNLWPAGDRVCFRGVRIDNGATDGNGNGQGELQVLNAMAIPKDTAIFQAVIAKSKANLIRNTNTRLRLPRYSAAASASSSSAARARCDSIPAPVMSKGDIATAPSSTQPRPDGWDLLLDSQTHARRGRLVQVQHNSAIIQHLKHGESNPVLVYFPRSACYKTPDSGSLTDLYRVGQEVLFVLSSLGYMPAECFSSSQFVCPYAALVYGQGFVQRVVLREAVVRSVQFGDLVMKNTCVGVRGRPLTDLWTTGDSVFFRGVMTGGGKSKLHVLSAMLLPKLSAQIQTIVTKSRANLCTNTRIQLQLPSASSLAGTSVPRPPLHVEDTSLWPSLSKEGGVPSTVPVPTAGHSRSRVSSVPPVPVYEQSSASAHADNAKVDQGWSCNDTVDSDSIWDDLDKELCDRFTSEFDLLETPSGSEPTSTSASALTQSSCSINHSVTNQHTASIAQQPISVQPLGLGTPHTYSNPQSYSTPASQSIPTPPPEETGVREHLLQCIMADPALSVLVFQKFPELAIQAFGN